MSGSLPKIRLGTRGSPLALAQSQSVKSQLEALGVLVEMVLLRTEGDLSSQSLSVIGGRGVFTKRIQTALLEDEIDLAVHSLKDLPTAEIPGLEIASVPARENPSDVLISEGGKRLSELPAGARIGTGSLRRRAQLLRIRRDLDVRDMRGNVDTRLQKLDDGEFDAIVLAAAGLIRLGLSHRIAEQFPTEQFLPAIGQGALALEIRSGDLSTAELVRPLNHIESRLTVQAERSMLRRFNAGCGTAIGALGKLAAGQLSLIGIVLSPDGREIVQADGVSELDGDSDLDGASRLGVEVAEKLLRQGADRILNLA